MRERFEQDGFTARVQQDWDYQGPDSWDTFGILAFDIRAYRVGELPRHWQDYGLESCKPSDAVAILPVHAYDGRNGAVVEVADDWDRANGWIYATQATVDMTGVPADAFEAALQQELATWNQYLGGDVYHVSIAGPDGEVVDSCGGFYGFDYAVEEARGMLKAAVQDEAEQSAKIASMMRV